MFIAVFGALILAGVALVNPAEGISAIRSVSEPCLDTSFQKPEPHIGDISDVRFLLWTRENMGDNDFCLLDHRDPDSLITCNFNANRPTYFYVHGTQDFQCDGMLPWILQAKNVILSLYNANVISVDWGELCQLPHYIQIVENLYKVGELTAELIDWLHEEAGLAPEQIEMAGHSLGAHVCGRTGKSVTTGCLGRITGMDPTGPLFHNTTGEVPLLPTDAIFVDIIHTNGGHFDHGEISMDERIGDVDFYVNGGSHQAGCDPPIPGGDFMDMLSGCSHRRSFEYWLESITAVRPDPTFASWPCDSWEDFENHLCHDCGQGCLDMGFHVNRDLEGAYYLATHRKAPFAKGDHQ